MNMSFNDILAAHTHCVGFFQPSPLRSKTCSREAAIQSQSEIIGSIPLREPTLYILLSLVPAPTHGYAIMKEVQNLSKGRVKLSTSTLYGALKRLLERGWIIRVEGSPTGGNGRERKLYSLTDLGRKVLGAEVKRLESILTTVRKRSLDGGADI